MWWGTPQERRPAPEVSPALGCSFTDLDVQIEPAPPGDSVLADGILSLYEKAQLCDVVFQACGEAVPAHKVIVAAMSSNFGRFVAQVSAQPPTDLEGSENPLRTVLSLPLPPQRPDEPVGSEAVSVPVAAVPTAAEAAAPTPAEPPLAEPPLPQTPQEAEEAAAAAPSAQAAAAPPVEAVAPAPPQQPSSAARGRGPERLELQVSGLSTVEALKLMLSYMYRAGTRAEWEYTPSSAEVNKDVLRLARSFDLPQLHENAARWLTRGLHTANVVERLVTCGEFGLGLLREKMIEQLTASPAELAAVSSSPEIMKHPRILQDLLVQVASFGVAAEKPERPEKPQKRELQEKSNPERSAAKRVRRGLGGA